MILQYQLLTKLNMLIFDRNFLYIKSIYFVILYFVILFVKLLFRIEWSFIFIYNTNIITVFKNFIN